MEFCYGRPGLLSYDERGDRAGSTIELDSSSPSLVKLGDNCNINQYRKVARLLTYTNQLKSLQEWYNDLEGEKLFHFQPGTHPWPLLEGEVKENYVVDC